MRPVPLSHRVFRPTRRELLQNGIAAGAGLVVGFHWPSRRVLAQDGESTPFAPNAFVRIAPDNTVTVLSKHIEFGQGSFTGLATILAEELDADWSTVRVEAAPSDPTRYNNLLFGPVQGTGGSTAIPNSWEQLRQAGAMARALLVHAAAAEWEVPATEIEVAGGRLSHAATQRHATFGEMADKAAETEAPAEVTLKDPADFQLIGTSVPRVDVPAKSDGSALFTADLDLPGMLTALVARSPRFGGKVAKVDDQSAREVPGVVDVFRIPTGIAVLARSFWAAKKGRDALEIEWDDSGAERRGSDEILEQYRSLAAEPGASVRLDGTPGEALEDAATVAEATYEFPFLAHAPMEPLDCVVRLNEEGCEVWAGSQLQTVDHNVIAGVLDLAPDRVRIHTMFAGGSFGRRATPNGDVAAEAASIAKAAGGGAPIKLIWTREDDIRGGRYRPAYVHRLRGALDADGEIVAWEQRIVGQSILKGTPFEAALVHEGIDHTSVEGALELPYAIPNVAVELHTTDVAVPVLWWRSVGHTHTAYAIETFLDELARSAGKDPVGVRRRLLREQPRRLAVLEIAAEKAGWGDDLSGGRARGVAVHKSFGTLVAQIAEVSVDTNGWPKVHKVVCAVDCGTPINPDNIRSQIEGSIGFGLGAAFHNEITLDEGRVEQSNFHNYKPLRMAEMPEVEVHIVESSEPPSGIGEPGVPPIAPAVANAIAALRGSTPHRLPFSRA